MHNNRRDWVGEERENINYSQYKHVSCMLVRVSIQTLYAAACLCSPQQYVANTTFILHAL